MEIGNWKLEIGNWKLEIGKIKKAINSADLSDKQVESFQRKGFLLLKNVFSEEFIQYIKRKIDDDIAKPSDKYQSGFNRIPLCQDCCPG
ncbi:hypothetical protein [Endozoicomonas sp. 8E]|uniref:hypothetical protein n=1 Tax=Endozoicomonas sp. 8E TaxID=3035692 RepID=UPI0029394E4B|nr:hypothetical protein [Endozoicomonas sp. 8E]WOG29456.1 hypothetical protein P6910_07345 [Endozoicomonas sp. 8E]